MINFTKRLTSVFCAVFLVALGCVTFSAESRQKLTDDANLLSRTEQNEITQMLEDASAQTDWDVIIYTNYNYIDEYDIEDYTNEYYDNHNYGIGDQKSGIILNIDMGSREMYVITKGETMYYISDERNDDMLDSIQAELISGDYYEAAETFVKYTVNYYEQGKPTSGTFTNVKINEKKDHPIRYSLIHYGIPSFIAGAIISLVTVFIIYRKYKNNGKKNIYDLEANSKTMLTTSNDIFLTKSVSVTTIQSDSSSSGGGHSGGGGGSSHGGGGRSF
ncbi:MAG: TPM domain-containing protein [Ruminococcus sp.]|nr:TPM domain-containing protein [Ruminococcus sp.]